MSLPSNVKAHIDKGGATSNIYALKGDQKGDPLQEKLVKGLENAIVKKVTDDLVQAPGKKVAAKESKAKPSENPSLEAQTEFLKKIAEKQRQQAGKAAPEPKADIFGDASSLQQYDHQDMVAARALHAARMNALYTKLCRYHESRMFAPLLQKHGIPKPDRTMTYQHLLNLEKDIKRICNPPSNMPLLAAVMTLQQVEQITKDSYDITGLTDMLLQDNNFMSALEEWQIENSPSQTMPPWMRVATSVCLTAKAVHERNEMAKNQPPPKDDAEEPSEQVPEAKRGVQFNVEFSEDDMDDSITEPKSGTSTMGPNGAQLQKGPSAERLPNIDEERENEEKVLKTKQDNVPIKRRRARIRKR